MTVYTGDLVLRRDGKEIRLRRVYGGLAWPAEFPGCVVAVGEEAEAEHHYRRAHYCHVLAVGEARDKEQLIELALEYQIQHAAELWFGRTVPPYREFLYHWNEKVRREGMPRLRLQNGHCQDDGAITFQVDLIRSLLKPPTPALYGLPLFETIRSQMAAVPLAYQDAAENEYPAVAALGYALAGLQRVEYSDGEDEDDYSRDRQRNRDPYTGY